MSFSDISLLAHRGSSAFAPENTRAAFITAKEHGATGVELDVSLLGDGSAVVFHDESIDRCTNASGLLKNLTLEEIKKLDAGSWFAPEFHNERILTLNEALTLLQTLKLDLNLEIKPRLGGERILVEQIASELKKHHHFTQKNLLISSFDFTALLLAQDLIPCVNLGILYEKALPKNWLEQAMRIHAKSINLNNDYVSESIITEIRHAGFYVYIWTVNNVKRGRQLLEMGVDGLITDQPQAFKSTLFNDKSV